MTYDAGYPCCSERAELESRISTLESQLNTAEAKRFLAEKEAATYLEQRNQAELMLKDQESGAAKIKRNLEARVAELEGALAPFGELVQDGTPDRIWTEDRDHWIATDHIWGRHVTVAMIRRAASVVGRKG